MLIANIFYFCVLGFMLFLFLNVKEKKTRWILLIAFCLGASMGIYKIINGKSPFEGGGHYRRKGSIVRFIYDLLRGR